MEGHRPARLLALSRIFVQHAFGDGAIDGRHRRLKKVAGCSGVAGTDGGAQPLDQRTNSRAVRAVDFRPLTSLRSALQNRLLLFLDFGRLSLSHLSLLLSSSQTSN